MKNERPLERLKAICEILNNKHWSVYRIETIQEALKDRDFNVQPGTITHDLRKLRDMGAPIPKNAGKGAGSRRFNFTEPYSFELTSVFNNTEREAFNLVRNLMEQYQQVPEFNDLRQAIDKVLGSSNYTPDYFVQPEIKPLTKGFQYFKILYLAIKNGQLAELGYRPNYVMKAKTYMIKPLLLKESSGMWYCIAQVDNKEIRVFSIDCIHKLTIKENPNKEKLTETELYDQYDHVFGIVKPEGIKKPTIIEIAFEPTLGEMLESKPLHPTQQVIDRNDHETIMQYSILYQPSKNTVVMRELHRELCKYAGSIRIIKPVELRVEIREMLERGVSMNAEVLL